MNNLPISFIEETASLFDSQIEREAFISSITDTQPPTSIRLNPCKPTDYFDDSEKVEWCTHGRYLSERPSFTLDPLFWGGAYYPQEASSMIVGEIVRHLAPRKVLDLCAAPGGKTTHIASIISEDSLFVSNEIIPNRAKVLVENVQRWGTGNVIVTNAKPKCFSNLSGYFDLILADVPCSGEGMFRKDHNSILEWSPQSVQACVSRSKSILCDVWDALLPGGYLIYSTCTYNRYEDEEMVNYIMTELGADYIPLDGIVPKSAFTSGYGYHFFPHRTKGEGFFVALLQKTSECMGHTDKIKVVVPFKKAAKNDVSTLRALSGPRNLDFRVIGDRYYGFPESISNEMDLIRGVVSPVYAGIQFGKIYAGKLKPSQPLAFYNELSFDSVSSLSLEDSLHYLKRDTQNPDLFRQGLSVVKYRNVSLGWANRIQGRVNNLYPSDLVIRQSICVNST